MPGNDFVIKQNVLGSAAGIALLAFALAWRFLPSFGGGSNPEKAVAEPPTSAPMSVQAPKEPAPVQPVASREPTVEAPAPPPPAKPAPPPPKAIAALLRKADKAFAEGHLLEPKETSAFALYTQVLDADKESAAARAGLTKIHDALLAQVNAALDRDDESDASRAIAQLETLPQTLPQQGTELEKLRARLKLLKQTGPLLTRAADLLNQGHATEPKGGNALAVYREVLKLDPNNKLAEQGLVQVQRGYLDRALAAAAQDDFGGADSILGEGSLVSPGSQELLDTRTRIEGIRRQRATNVLMQANSALDAGNADLAQLLAQKALGLSPDLAGVDQFNERLRNARLYASFSPGQVITDKFLDRSGSAPPLIVVPTGSFMMGSPDSEEGHRANEEPLREVKLAVGVALGRDDVTVGQFRAFASDADYITTAEENGTSSVYDEESGRMIDRPGASWRDNYVGDKAADDLPVLHVSWTDAQAYVQWLSTRTGKKYRLPSEAEFEYALRAGTATRFPWGDKNPAKVYGNLTGDGDRSPHLKRSWAKAFPRYSDGFWGPSPVGSFAASRLGLHDIEGNVSIWVEDCWHDNYTRAPSDSRAWMNPGCAEHVIRGASWGSSQDQSRSAYRLAAPTQTRSARVGMRVARDL